MRNDAAAGGIVRLVFIFLLAAVLFVVMGYGIDRLTLLAQGVMTLDASQMRYDSLNIQLILFRLQPLILLLGAGINYWITQSRQQSGVVDVGGLLSSGAEMILGSFVLMVLCFFGGAALDAVVGVLEVWSFNPSPDLYSVTQYLGISFYGIMTLLIVSLMAMFVVKCFQMVDYASTPQVF